MTQTIHRPALAYLAEAPRLPVFAELTLRATVVLVKWAERSRTRKTLADLDDHILRDVGLDRRTAHREAHRMFWQG